MLNLLLTSAATEFLKEWLREKWNWFSASEDSTTEQVQFQGQEVPLTQWDMRIPGKFKAELKEMGYVLTPKCIPSGV